jgi:hypothetical protein
MGRKSHIDHTERLPWIQGNPRKAFVVRWVAGSGAGYASGAFPVGAMGFTVHERHMNPGSAQVGEGRGEP